MKEKIDEIRVALLALGYQEGEPVKVVFMDESRATVYCKGLTVGIYDFNKHTFVD